MHPTVDILMASYNGQKYIAQQLDSILHQTYPHIRIIVRDDGSSDHTPQILQTYARRYSDKIHLLPMDQNLGIRGNFSKLMESATSPYIMLSDQDDIWDKEKVANSLARMRIMENRHGKNIPLLVHTDLKVVDGELNLIHPSFWKYAKLYPEKGLTLNRLLIQNVITGCTVMMNQPLIKLALPIPQETLMHDWWLGLVASTFGAIGYVEKSTIYYRQHGLNNLGAQKYGFFSLLQKWLKILQNKAEGKHYLESNLRQAQVFKERFQGQMSTAHLKMVDDYLNLHNFSLLKDLYLTFKHGFFRHGSTRNAGIIFFKILKRIKPSRT